VRPGTPTCHRGLHSVRSKKIKSKWRRKTLHGERYCGILELESGPLLFLHRLWGHLQRHAGGRKNTTSRSSAVGCWAYIAGGDSLAPMVVRDLDPHGWSSASVHHASAGGQKKTLPPGRPHSPPQIAGRASPTPPPPLPFSLA